MLYSGWLRTRTSRPARRRAWKCLYKGGGDLISMMAEMVQEALM